MRLKKNVVTRNLRKHQPKTGQKSFLYTLFYGKKGYFAGTSLNASQKKAVADSADPMSTSYTEVVYRFVDLVFCVVCLQTT